MQEYRFKFYLNAMHSISIEGNVGEMHPHTWEIAVDVFKQSNNFITFSEVEKPVESVLGPLQDKIMNTTPPFDSINPTLENVAIYLQKRLEAVFLEHGFIMSRITVSETPSRSFIIDIKDYEDFEVSPAPLVNTNAEKIEEEADNLIEQKIYDLNLDHSPRINNLSKLKYSYKRNENKRKVRRGLPFAVYTIIILLIILSAAAAVIYFKR
jgi:6-pyruvoyltetrahydropterin/6-carboxytetrahydropterin synthase